MSDFSQKSYLGDGVYACFDGHHVVLTVENGIQTTDAIYLDPHVLEALQRYVMNLKKASSDE